MNTAEKTASLYYAFRKLVKRGYKEVHTKESRAELNEQIDTARKNYEESAAIVQQARKLAQSNLHVNYSSTTLH